MNEKKLDVVSYSILRYYETLRRNQNPNSIADWLHSVGFAKWVRWEYKFSKLIDAGAIVIREGKEPGWKLSPIGRKMVSEWRNRK